MKKQNLKNFALTNSVVDWLKKIEKSIVSLYQIVNKYKVFLFLPDDFLGGSGPCLESLKERGRRDHGDR